MKDVRVPRSSYAEILAKEGPKVAVEQWLGRYYFWQGFSQEKCEAVMAAVHDVKVEDRKVTVALKMDATAAPGRFIGNGGELTKPWLAVIEFDLKNKNKPAEKVRTIKTLVACQSLRHIFGKEIEFRMLDREGVFTKKVSKKETASA